ncbi:MAG TPA: ATP-binding protein [Verrucomicrobiae bacterium]|nr:ATP-binding protein [Verrucomicrobiae bacterium]
MAFYSDSGSNGFTAYFATAAQLFRELERGRADGSYGKKLRALGQVDALIVDDWAMAPMGEAERSAFSGNLRRALPDQVNPTHQPTAGREVARTDR